MKEGIAHNVYNVGDIMADSVRLFGPKARSESKILGALALEPKKYALATCHRPVNTDSEASLRTILMAFAAMPIPVVFPIHPRAMGAVKRYGLADWLSRQGNIRLIEPVGYLDMLHLQQSAALVVTDSGGVQKEAYYCHTRCLTLRDETEWVETVNVGWNRLCAIDKDDILASVSDILASNRMPDHPDLYGDGCSSARIVEVLSC